MAGLISLFMAVFWIGIVAAAIGRAIKSKDAFASYTSGRHNYRDKIPSQTNRLSQRILQEHAEMQELEEEHEAVNCKYTYTTQNPNFSFNGLPNDYDDFAELRKKNAAHERHLQRKIY